jgi:hypothetical protein
MKTTRTMASAIRSKKKLVLSHFPLLGIRVPLYYHGKQHFCGTTIYLEVLLPGIRL